MKSTIQCKNEGIEKICIMLENPTTPKIQDELYETDDNKITGTCALGEIGLQLNTDLVMSNVIDGMIKMGIPRHLVNDAYTDDAILRKSIINWNDNTSLSKPEIAQEIRAKFGDVE